VNAVQRRRFVGRILWIVTPVALVAILRPWTVRPIADASVAAFDAGTFARSAWPRVVREATQAAAAVSDLALASGAPAANARFLKGTGVIAAVDRQSRVGVLRVRVAGSRPATVAIQIGPVIRGTALRDASPFIQFSDFTNQSDFAAAANALNDHVLREVIAAVPLDGLVGRTVTFVGAIGKSPLREDGAIEMVPVQLELPEAAAP
jgi:predicted lipoprotein